MSESTRVSDEWVADINTLYQGVMVPAPDLVRIYRESGIRVPVHYVPMGVTPPTAAMRRQQRGDRFVFLTYSLGEMRKGAELAVMAFKELFGGDPRFELLIKTPAERAPWHHAVQNEQISIVNGSLSEQAWAELLAEADCFVFPSRGEGFGLPPREATLVGTPAIATEWLGLWDVSEWGYPIGVQELRPAPFLGDANHPNALWAEPNMDDLRALMTFAVEHHREALDKADCGQAYLSTFTWEAAAKGVLDVICGGNHA
ncbi:MAG: glycosyltransferase [Anaerolineae bacterium]|nr:glycosyltransferase [Anaerolineae bacterium]